MSNEYDEAVLDAFLEQQEKLFPEPVAEDREEAEEFLSDSMAVVVDSIEEAIEYLEELGMDVAEMEAEDIAEAEEVFAVGDGRYLIVDV
ncbi:MAG: glyoxalase [Lachnospiraceae bacterium]|nr:glyoxalase [Lachnospiraceae bacterium]